MTLRSKRLTYRYLTEADTDALHAIMSDWAVVRQLGGWPWPADRDFTLGRCRQFKGQGFVFGAFHDGGLVGTIGVTDGSIGYCLGQDHWGQGFGTEMGQFGVAHGFATQSIPMIKADAWADNAASIRLLEKLGFREVARTVEHAKARNAPTPSVAFELHRDRWQTLSATAQSRKARA